MIIPSSFLYDRLSCSSGERAAHRRDAMLFDPFHFFMVAGQCLLILLLLRFSFSFFFFLISSQHGFDAVGAAVLFWAA